MANDILGALFDSGTFRVIDDAANKDLGITFNILDVHIRLSAELLSNSDEQGRPATDARYTKPIEIDVNCFMGDIQNVSLLNDLFLNQNKIYNIATRGLIFKSFYLINGQDLQDSEVLSAYPFQLKFRQLLIPTADQSTCQDNGDASTVLGGIKQAVDKTVNDFKNTVSDKVDEIESLV